MRLYIIRHAQSFNNALADQKDRVCDPDLTDLGREQAEILAHYLADGVDPDYHIGVSEEDTGVDHRRRGFRISQLYCSAMHRSLLTAKPIAKKLGLTAHVWIDIHEHGGIFLEHADRGLVGYPGLTRAEILSQFPDYILPDEISDAGWWKPELGREDWPTCQGRAIRVCQALRKKAEERENIAIISHGGFIDALLKAVTNQLPSSSVFYHHYNTSITRVDFRPNGAVDIRYINRFDHLPIEMVS